MQEQSAKLRARGGAAFGRKLMAHNKQCHGRLSDVTYLPAYSFAVSSLWPTD
jgi:hypothetical protein